MSNKEAALIEPLSVSIHVADRANVTEKTLPSFWGAGIIGAGVAARLVDRGAAREHIVFVDRLAVPARSSWQSRALRRQQRGARLAAEAYRADRYGVLRLWPW